MYNQPTTIKPRTAKKNGESKFLNSINSTLVHVVVRPSLKSTPFCNQNYTNLYSTYPIHPSIPPSSIIAILRKFSELVLQCITFRKIQRRTYKVSILWNLKIIICRRLFASLQSKNIDINCIEVLKYCSYSFRCWLQIKFICGLIGP